MSRIVFRDQFYAADTDLWTVATGTGQSVAYSASGMTITMGTTANAETTVTSNVYWLPPVRAQVQIRVSQKIANNHVRVELVSMQNANVVAAWDISGDDNASLTNATYEVANGQSTRLRAANQSVNSVTSDQILEIELTQDEVWFHYRNVDSTNANSGSYVRNSVAPNPQHGYRLRIRCTNGSSAPASSTTVTVTNAFGMDYVENTTEITAGRGQNQSKAAIPVLVTTSANNVLAPSASAGTATSQKVANAAGGTTPTTVKASSGRLYGWQLTNTGAATAYMRLYDKATAPTVGTDSPAMVIVLPPGQPIFCTADISLRAFNNGIGFAITAGAADLDATNITNANEVIGSLFYA